MSQLKTGIVGEAKVKVTPDNTAVKFGSGAVDVFATPAMIGLMENAAINAVDKLLPQGQATVGTKIESTHTAATPIGMEVTAKATLVELDRKRLVFKVEAYDEKEKIGEGTHERFIIDLEKFLQKAGQK
jgi:fluoroacetyl-CoA thioesterase